MEVKRRIYPEEERIRRHKESMYRANMKYQQGDTYKEYKKEENRKNYYKKVFQKIIDASEEEGFSKRKEKLLRYQLSHCETTKELRVIAKEYDLAL